MGRKQISNLEASPELQFEYFRTLLNESDRGFVILTASRIDELLEHLHKTFIRSIAKPQDKFINELFSAHAPLSTFSAKIALAFGYGLISEEDYLDISLLRGLRNDAAHTVAEFSFQMPEIGRRILKIAVAKRIPQLLHRKFREFGIGKWTDAQQDALESPKDDYDSTKMHFLIIGMSLSLVIMDKIGTILQRDWNSLKTGAIDASCGVPVAATEGAAGPGD